MDEASWKVVLPRRDGFKRIVTTEKSPRHHHLPAARRKVWSASLNGATVRQGVQVANNSSLNLAEALLFCMDKTTQTGSWKRITKRFCWLLVLMALNSGLVSENSELMGHLAVLVLKMKRWELAPCVSN